MRIVAVITAVIVASVLAGTARADDRPNILWVTSEDNGPHLGCYGDAYADTPNLDALAARGAVYLNAWSNAPVCAPARTTIITGMYATSLGAQHMRSAVRIPEHVRLLPQYLRDAGYYCTNRSKTDYNLAETGQVWDESGRQAHWRNRGPDQPFFAVFNFTMTHESRIRQRPHEPVHDPAGVRVPAYHPDTPVVRRDWAQYHDKMTEMDGHVGRVLAQLEADGLADDTIVFYFADHGPGMPRAKRWPYDSGLHVPLIVSVPERYRAGLGEPGGPGGPGGRSDRLVGFVDLAPTALALAGVTPPAHMEGTVFIGAAATPPPRYLHGFRGRMDERIDMVRTTRDARFVYVRNYMPHRRYGEHLDYMFKTPTTRAWRDLFEQGRLDAAQSRFWRTKPLEELYDLATDPDEVHDLAGSDDHREVLQRMRAAQREHLLRTRDTGFMPEPMMHARAGDDTTVRAMARGDRYDLSRALDAAGGVIADLRSPDPAIRYWSVIGLLVRETSHDDLEPLLDDPSPSVRIVAAEALARYGPARLHAPSVELLLDLGNVVSHGPYASTLALNSLDALPAELIEPYADDIAALPIEHPSLDRQMRMKAITGHLVRHLRSKAVSKPR